MNRSYKNLSLTMLIYCIAVIVWGAFVRATGSGAGCGAHWPLCNGVVVPRSAQLETIIELTHRVTSGLILLLVILAAYIGFKNFPKKHPIRFASILCVVFVLIEALIGAGIVLLELVADNDSFMRAYWVGGHLVNTLLLVGVLTYHYWLSYKPRVHFRWPSLTDSWFFYGAIFLALSLGASGAMVALGDTLFPAASLVEGMKQDFDPSSHILVRLRFWHPLIAFLFAGYAVVMCNFLARKYRGTNVQYWARFNLVTVMSQMLIGLLNLFLLAPVWLQLVHLTMANVLWIGLVWLFLEYQQIHRNQNSHLNEAPTPIPGLS